VKAVAGRLATAEAAYEFVRDRIIYDPSLPLAPPVQTLKMGRASCLSKAALLASLYRTIGVADNAVRVVTGQAYWQNDLIEHAWLEIEHDGRCLQQDPTSLFGVFAFDEFQGTAFTRAYVRREFFAFNDRGFAVVSLDDRFRGGVDPHAVAVAAQ
jgi:transglutaminase-like putative cysteine protease